MSDCTLYVAERPFHSTGFRDEPPADVRPTLAAPRPYCAVTDFLTIGIAIGTDASAYASLKRLDRELLALRNLTAFVRDYLPNDGSAADLSARIADHEAAHGGLPRSLVVADAA